MTEKQVEQASHIASLIVKRMREELTEEEWVELESWMYASSENYLLYEELMDEDTLLRGVEEMQSVDTAGALKKFEEKVFNKQLMEAASIVPVKKRNTAWYYLTGGILLVTASIVTIYLVSSHKPVVASAISGGKSIQPGNKKAILQLADGSTIALDNKNTGKLAEQGNISVMNENGELKYEPGTTNNSQGKLLDNSFNTISTPNGGEYAVVLDDGTTVWLNAASSLHYPARFSGKERRVVLIGEAYFKVAHNDKAPFIVSSGGMEIQDLGTEFNVKAYENDKNTQATLVHGKVNISYKDQKFALDPGKKLVIQEGHPAAIGDADLEQETAWKNGEFYFNNASLHEVMNQLARWYNVEVAYQGNITESHFMGGFSRTVLFSKALERLELTGGVHFSVQGNKVTVATNAD